MPMLFLLFIYEQKTQTLEVFDAVLAEAVAITNYSCQPITSFDECESLLRRACRPRKHSNCL